MEDAMIFAAARFIRTTTMTESEVDDALQNLPEALKRAESGIRRVSFTRSRSYHRGRVVEVEIELDENTDKNVLDPKDPSGFREIRVGQSDLSPDWSLFTVKLFPDGTGCVSGDPIYFRYDPMSIKGEADEAWFSANILPRLPVKVRTEAMVKAGNWKWRSAARETFCSEVDRIMIALGVQEYRMTITAGFSIGHYNSDASFVLLPMGRQFDFSYSKTTRHLRQLLATEPPTGYELVNAPVINAHTIEKKTREFKRTVNAPSSRELLDAKNYLRSLDPELLQEIEACR